MDIIYLKIKLKEAWDFPQSSDFEEDQVGVFGGRQGELARLKNLLVKKNKSSILLTGHRGRGKTSVIYKALWDINREKKENEVKIIPILIDALQLESRSEDLNNNTQGNLKNNYRIILENIICRFYQTIKETKLKGLKQGCFRRKLKNLHLKNLATEWQKNHIVDIGKSYYFRLHNIVSFGVLLVIFYTDKFVDFVSDYWKMILFAVPALIIICDFCLKIVKRESFKYDKSYNYLENEFRRLLNKKNLELNFVFIVDELDFFMLKDKSSDDDFEYKSINKTRLPGILKAYKNLFQFINSPFIFIGDDALYEGVVRQKQEDNILSTVFTDVIYLSPPSQGDLSRFLDNIVDNESKQSDEYKEKWEDLKYYLMYKGKGDFRKTALAVKDFIREDPEYFLIKESEFPSGERGVAKAYRILTQLYDQEFSREPLRGNENENLFESLYEIINPEVWTDGGYNFTYNERDEEAKKKQEFLIDFLKKYGVLEIKKYADSEFNIKGNKISAYSLPSLMKEPTLVEQNLKKEIDNIKTQSLDISRQFNLDEENLDEIFEWFNGYVPEINYIVLSDAESRYKEIVEARGRLEDTLDLNAIPAREEIQPYIENLINVGKILHKEKANLFKNRVSELSDSYKQELYDKTQDKLFRFLPEELKNELNGGTVFYLDNDFSKQLAILDVEDKKIEELNKIINESGYEHSYKIVNANTQIDEVEKWIENFSVSSIIGSLFIERGVPCKRSDNNFILNKVSGVKVDGSGDVNTFLRTKGGVLLRGHFKFRVRVESNSIINFVVGFHKNKDYKYNWRMARLDTRDPVGGNGCGILKKELGANWKYDDLKKYRVRFPANEEREVFLDFSEKNIELYSFKKKKKMKGNKENDKIIWAKARRNIVPGQLGFFNELGKVELEIFDNDFDEQ